jgi:hypothetical protein
VHLKHGYCMLIHFIHGYYCIYRPRQPLIYLCFPYHCISLIYFSFTKIRMFLYAQIYWLVEFGDVSCLQFNYLRVETLTPTWEDLSDNFKSEVRPESMIVDTLGGICTWKYSVSSTFLYNGNSKCYVVRILYAILFQWSKCFGYQGQQIGLSRTSDQWS